ncbi:uncharacterized protein LOC111635233 [Centruroides sculpturatus]|uniref:uncharacterized protein LOC111635233 n=1 Tax=Centruroides sculpturatus TaxID=218467 RepID=UPI000C6D8E5E|nr:uncharacterized protein LOC111635233 [Centruroides sculpturatus]
MKAHQSRSEACRVSIEATSPPPPLPTDRVIQHAKQDRQDDQEVCQKVAWLATTRQPGNCPPPLYAGGTNVTPSNQLADIAQIAHAMYLLNAKDPNIMITIGTLNDIVRKHIGRTPNPDDLCCYLDGSMEGEFGLPSTDITSMWTRLRMATRRLRKRIDIAWTVGPDNLPTITAGTTIIRASDCQRIQCSLMKDLFLKRLLTKPDQGKAYGVTTTSAASNHFLNNGKYTSFADWYFIHRAHMSVVALRGHKRYGNDTKQCRHCGYTHETLAHVLSLPTQPPSSNSQG